jgi:hypothetical protein
MASKIKKQQIIDEWKSKHIDKVKLHKAAYFQRVYAKSSAEIREKAKSIYHSNPEYRNQKLLRQKWIRAFRDTPFGELCAIY